MLGLSSFTGRRRAIFLALATAASLICLANLYFLDSAFDGTVSRIPGAAIFRHKQKTLQGSLAREGHPIVGLMQDANEQWQRYQEDRSRSFRQTVAKYRQINGRHPPPGFKEWYQYARERNVYNVDDFQQIMADLRPFWAIPPKDIRKMAAHLQHSDGIAGVSIRDHKPVPLKVEGWRVESLFQIVRKLAPYLPDMDIAMNVMDQPRILVTFDDVQNYLAVEESTRSLPPNATDGFTSQMQYFYDDSMDGGKGARAAEDHNTNSHKETLDPAWFSAAGKPYMEFAKDACPPESPARNNSISGAEAEATFKASVGGFVANFTAASDLCTVGPAIGDQHGFLSSASSNVISRKLLPVFSECKVSVNNDILFPANMYFLKDKRYHYQSQHDYEWEDKTDSLIWRGVTSGGIQVEDNWHRLHRQRFVRLANATEMDLEKVSILAKNDHGDYHLIEDFNPSDFAASNFDVGFTEAIACIPGDCPFYKDVWTYKKPEPFSEQFKSKYLVDLDGHSFSGRWRAFLQSKSLGVKATIFREWHDSRLFAWRHFVPMDNKYGEFYSLMTYFLGLEPSASPEDLRRHQPTVPRHDLEAEVIATQGREWANLALRDDDLYIYMYLLLLEYGRVIDDNREHIGYSGDGSELDLFDTKHPFPSALAQLLDGQ
ncbi:hypothetical protein N7539_002720 [Penicillium diatomitis]|uniref:Glycosyl transferase CAP10 domain-containing protein n=1 Tax=Penicillium diatomitis TaxID=2819901 RepID=A0A9W9XG58_9EURO|nr:uncharacterized protein N7539_002720 [Penicillium diatomitis]KAJ5491153.1 hypothetical protein N7539_002720 [Penicillium diatomitis]